MYRVLESTVFPRVGASLAAALVAAALGCGEHATKPPETRAASNGSPALTATRPQKETLRRTIEEPGQIEAFETTPIYSKIAGYVSEVCVDMDAKVKRDQVLAKLWVPELKDEVNERDAMVSQSKAGLEQAEKTLKALEAHCRTAEALVTQALTARKSARANCERWRLESKRIGDLVSRNVIDAQQRDETRNQFAAAESACEEIEAKIKAAEAALEESEAQRLKAAADVSAAKAHLRLAETQLQHAKTMLAYSDIKAPYDGVITRRNVHTGHLRRAVTSGASEPLFLMVRRDRVRVFVDVPEPEAPYVRKGTPLRLRIQALNDREFDATVTRTSYAVDPASRTLRTEIEIDNSKDELRPGMYAYAIITAEHPNALTMPAKALLRQDDAYFCWEYLDGKAVRTLVRTGLRTKDRVEILKKRRPGPEDRWQDFTGNEQILVGNLASVTDGEPVNLAAAN